MKLENIDMLELIPPYMQDDITVKGLCAAGNYILKQLYELYLKWTLLCP